jgi:hypothetical protein
MARSLSKERLSSEGREFFRNCDIYQLIQGHAFLFCSPTRFFEQRGLKSKREITLFHRLSSSVSVLPGESLLLRSPFLSQILFQRKTRKASLQRIDGRVIAGLKHQAPRSS